MKKIVLLILLLLITSEAFASSVFNPFTRKKDYTATSTAPENAPYVTLALDATLTTERVLTAGLAVDLADTGANGTITVAFDPTEITGGTTWDDGGEASVAWTFNLSGTDPVITAVSGGFDVTGDFDVSSTIEAGSGNITLTNATGNLDGEVIANDTIDDDSIDFGVGADQVSASDMPNEDLGEITVASGVYSVDDSLAVSNWSLTTPNITTSATMSDGATIGQAAGPLVAFDDTNNYLEITGANVGIGTATPAGVLHVEGVPIFRHATTPGIALYTDATLSSEDGYQVIELSDALTFRDVTAGTGATLLTLNRDGSLLAKNTTAGSDTLLSLAADDDGNAAIFGKDSTDDAYMQIYDGSGNPDIQLASDGDSYFMGNGEVGIGIAAPVSLLHVSGGTGDPTARWTKTGLGETATDGFVLSMWGDGGPQLWSFEDQDMRFGVGNSQKMLIAKTTGAITIASTLVSSATDTIGWSVVAAANQACTTTCTSACVFGFDTGLGGTDLLDCADATSDRCVCAGSS